MANLAIVVQAPATPKAGTPCIARASAEYGADLLTYERRLAEREDVIGLDHDAVPLEEAGNW